MSSESQPDKEQDRTPPEPAPDWMPPVPGSSAAAPLPPEWFSPKSCSQSPPQQRVERSPEGADSRPAAAVPPAPAPGNRRTGEINRQSGEFARPSGARPVFKAGGPIPAADLQLAITKYKSAAPCSASWDEMSGTGRFRVCGTCQLYVYDARGIGLNELLELVFRREGKKNPCLFKRSDGRFLTANCPVGVRRRRNLALTCLGTVLLLAGATVFAFSAPNRPAGPPDQAGQGKRWDIESIAVAQPRRQRMRQHRSSAQPAPEAAELPIAPPPEASSEPFEQSYVETAPVAPPVRYTDADNLLTPPAGWTPADDLLTPQHKAPPSPYATEQAKE